MKKKMKMGFKSYFAPTPKNIRKIADSILAAALMAGTFSFAMEHKTVAVVVMVIGVVAKFVSNLFGEVPEEEEDDTTDTIN
jgi:hypothetical protein